MIQFYLFLQGEFMLPRLAAVLLSAILLSCQVDESNSLIKAGRGGGGDDRGDKPTEVLQPQVMLMAAGMAELHQLAKAALTDMANGCLKRTDSSLTWRCETGAGRVARKGTATLSRNGDVISVTAPRLGIYNFLRAGGLTRRGQQEFDLTLVKTGNNSYRFRYLAGTEIANRARGQISYHFEWDLSGTILAAGETATLSDTDGTLTVTQSARAAAPTTAYSYEMTAIGPLTLEVCGNFGGRLSFSGHKQSAVTVIADPESGLKAETGGKAQPWPACDAQIALYGLEMVAGFWLNPRP